MLELTLTEQRLFFNKSVNENINWNWIGMHGLPSNLGEQAFALETIKRESGEFHHLRLLRFSTESLWWGEAGSGLTSCWATSRGTVRRQPRDIPRGSRPPPAATPPGSEPSRPWTALFLLHFQRPYVMDSCWKSFNCCFWHWIEWRVFSGSHLGWPQMLQINKGVIECSGFHGNCLTLAKIIEARLKMFKYYNIKAGTIGPLLQGLLQSSIQGVSFHITFTTSSGWRSKGCGVQLWSSGVC